MDEYDDDKDYKNVMDLLSVSIEMGKKFVRRYFTDLMRVKPMNITRDSYYS
jgi:hypothetical protein